MKIRFGFVSNSSSCSFMCPVCDNSFFGWDWDDDPVCDTCGVHINIVKTFSEFLIQKYGLNEEEERRLYISSQGGHID